MSLTSMQDEERLADVNVGNKSLRYGWYHIRNTHAPACGLPLVAGMVELTKEKQETMMFSRRTF